MGDDHPKYLNSPETPAYVKGEHLYGLFQSKDEIRKKKFAILVEGYLDLIALVQHDIKNVAASLGTAFTPDQSKLLGRFTKKIVINYDGDVAGIGAARRAVEILLPNDFEIKVLVLPDGKDPDDFVREHGTKAYNEARGRAIPFLEFVLDSSMQGRALANAKQKAEAIEEVLPVLSDIKNPIQKRESFDQAMNFFRVESSGLKRDLWSAVKQGSKLGSDTLRKQVKRATAAKITVAEQQLLELLVYDPDLRDKVLPLLEETDYESLATAPVFRALSELNPKGEDVTLEKLTELTGEDEILHDFLPLLMMAEPKRDGGEAIDEVLHLAENCVLTLRSMAITNRILEVSHELIAAEQSRDLERINELVAEHLDLSKMKQHLLNKISET